MPCPTVRYARSNPIAARRRRCERFRAISNEDARDVARVLSTTAGYEQSRRDRKRVEMLFAHLKRILALSRLRLCGPRGAQFEFTLTAIAQNLRRLAKLIARPPPVASVA